MGLFINENGHPNVFKNNTDIVNRNQEHSKIDPLAEWIKEQKDATESANRQLTVMETLLKHQKNTQSNQMKSIRNRLLEIKESDFRRERFENDVMKSFSNLEDTNRVLQQSLKHERILNRELIGQVTDIGQSNQEIANCIKTSTSVNEAMMIKMNNQINNQQQLSEQFSKHEDVQKDVVSKLDKQGGLLEKVVRQLDYLRSVLYGRTNFLTGKIEDGYGMTSSYISKLLTGPNQTSEHFMVKEKLEEKKKTVE
jgi:hypothetical protein